VILLLNIREVFNKISKFKTTNTQFHANTTKKLLNLCSKIYGSSNVTNDEFMSWVVKGYIAEVKGFDITWVKVATSTTKEKAHRVVVEKTRSNKSLDVLSLVEEIYLTKQKVMLCGRVLQF
jgi:hypothetical protein